MMMQFGKTKNNEEAMLYTLENDNRMLVTVSDYGATLVQILVPDKKGELVDVVLGYDDVRGYEEGDLFLGAIVGRVANRIGGARFTLNGREYFLSDNDNGNNLHSGPDFFSKRMWNVIEATDKKVVFALHSKAGDQGYPGEVFITVTYELTQENELKISYGARPNQDTLLNMTNHSYFNMDGHKSKQVMHQEVWIHGDSFTPSNEALIPTGELKLVKGTPMDFTVPKEVGLDIESDYEAIKHGGGYDHNYVINGNGYRKAAFLHSKANGIKMEVYTDLPGMQFYSGNFIQQTKGRNGAVYKKRQGLCFETQYFPDGINQTAFTSPITKGGEEYHTVTTYKFGIE